MDDNGWLVLTRKDGEDIWIGDDVCLRVNEIRVGKVRLMFKAPTSTRIDRAEVRRDMASECDVRFEHGGFSVYSLNSSLPWRLDAEWSPHADGWVFQTKTPRGTIYQPIGQHWIGVALGKCAESIGAAARVGR